MMISLINEGDAANMLYNFLNVLIFGFGWNLYLQISWQQQLAINHRQWMKDGNSFTDQQGPK